MEFYRGLVLLVVFLYMTDESDQKVCLSRGKRQKYIKAKCCNGGMIFQPEIVGFSEKKCNRKRAGKGCSGTSPELIAQTHECFWKNQCCIYPRNSLMISKCYKKIKSIEMRQGWCISNGTRILDMLEDKRSLKQFDMSETVMIRSHKDYPWNYRYNHFGNKRYNITFKINHSPNPVLVFKVVSLDIDSEQDDLFLVNGERKVKVNTSEKTQKFELKYQTKPLYLEFYQRNRYGNFSIARGSGFVICMKIVDNPSELTSPCNDVMSRMERKKNFQIERKSGKRKKRLKPLCTVDTKKL